MRAYPLRASVLTIVTAIGLSACTTPYDYGYGGVSLGIGNGYYDPYYSHGYGVGYSPYAYGYGFDPYWGWYDDFYYPGTGYYVYDIYRRPHRWSDAQRRYWTVRREHALRSSTPRRPVTIHNNWGGFDHERIRGRNRIERDIDHPVVRVERSNRSVRIERGVTRRDREANAVDQRRSQIRSAPGRDQWTGHSRGRHSGNKQEE